MGRSSSDRAFHRPFAKLAALKAPPGTLARKKDAAPPAPSARSTLRKSDEEIFLEEVAGARPLETRSRVSATRGEGRPKPRSSDDAEVLAELADLCDGSGTFDIADTDEYIEGIAAGIDRRILRRLRAGEYAVQAHVDLHGLTRDDAKRRVGKFVDESRRAGHRCVLLVHGRGHHSKDHIPVLKQAVRSWLERGQIARSVLAFATARPHDGGAGAVYVLLRR